ncbi:sugar transferase [Bryobacter aggregatus]|uniref:sugar transferase n=1 Tax=Bryobacter aggregatus TaxID=360054 RepID=UPI00068F52AF|nr:sugar transferase [Bryobacter aggregatus]
MPRIRTLLLLAGDITILFASYLLVAWAITAWGGIWGIDFWFFLTEENSLAGITFVTTSVVLGLYFLDRYEKVRISSRRPLLEDLTLVFGITFLLQAFISYARIPLVLSRYLMLGGSVVAIFGLLYWRKFYSSLILQAFGRQRIIFIGDSPIVRVLARFILDRPECGFHIAAVFHPTPVAEFPGCTVSIPDESFLSKIQELTPDLIAVAPDLEANPDFMQDLLQCSMKGMAVKSTGDLYEDLLHRVSLETLSTKQLIFSPAFRPRFWVVAWQAIYGRVFAIAGLLLAWPFMILTAIAVRLDSPGPAILRQTRLGQGGIPFPFLKFRSMYVDADARSGPVRAQENDPRITRVGRWIRLTRLDELPQLINVLRGEMTLVGPRPEMPELEKRLLVDLPLYTQRHRIKPGITGWAQIHHEPEDSIASTARKLEYDLYYIKNMSPALDILTLFHTVKAVLLRIGAR